MAVEQTIRQAESRLLDLLQKRTHLRDRIFELRNSTQEFKTNKKLKVSFHATLAARNQFAAAMPRRPVIWRSTKLRRACRIALIETSVPETAPQIVARIAARNSYSFSEGIDAVSAIMPELKRLVLQGQAYFTSKNGVRSWGWQRN